MNIATARTLSDTQLIAEVKRLAGCEREVTVRLIIHLAELERRQLYLGAGYRSLFEYCTEVLRLSEHETYNRIEAARAARRYPTILDMLVEGSLTLTSVRLLAPHLAPENQDRLLAAARGKGKRQVQELIASLFPRPESPPVVRKLPEPRAAATALPVAALPVASGEPAPAAPVWAPVGRGEPAPTGSAARAADHVTAPVAPAGPLPVPRAVTAPPRPAATPVAADRYQIRFTAGVATYEKLRLAEDLLRHAIPDGDPAQILDRALTSLLWDLARRKFAATERPRPGKGAGPGSRYIPATVKRTVWVRDLARCVFVAPDGRRCSARGFLEFHHVDPHGVGGKATVDKVELRCGAHNRYEAQLFYGPMKEHVGAAAV